MGARVRASTLRRLYQVAAAVVLIAAGVLLGMHVSPEMGATLVAGGAQVGIGAITGKKDERGFTGAGSPGMALGFA